MIAEMLMTQALVLRSKDDITVMVAELK